VRSGYGAETVQTSKVTKANTEPSKSNNFDLTQKFLSRIRVVMPIEQRRRARRAMNGARSQAMCIAAAAGLEVVTGASLFVAPSLLAGLLFGSEMNVAGDLVARISGLVMLCLSLGCWPRAFKGEGRQTLTPLLALSLLAAVFLIYVAYEGRMLARCFGRPPQYTSSLQSFWRAPG